jgi:hypothetical protein
MALWALGAFGVVSACVSVAAAQTAEIKEKPPMYTYFSNWTIPRAKWPDMAKLHGPDAKLEHGLSSGALIGYGDDEVVAHTPEGYTHDDWFSSMSMAGLLNTLADVMQGTGNTTGVLTSATKHADEIFESRFYHWRSGSWKGAYTRTGIYKLKDTAPSNAVEILARGFMVPFLEKLLADGTLVEYEIDEMALHSEAPGYFYVVFITPTAEGQDQVLKGLEEAFKANPLVGPSLDSMIDYSAHRDLLVRGNATYK